MSKTIIPTLAAISLFFFTPLFAQTEAQSASAGDAAPAPKMTVSNEKPDASCLLQEKDLLDANFTGTEPDFPFPLKAQHAKITEGRASVGIMLDADGNPTDVLILRYTHVSFADEMVAALHRAEFRPRRIKNDCVSGRFCVSRVFEVGTSDVVDPNKPAPMTMNAMEQMGAMSDRVSNAKNGPKYAYRAHEERELDGNILKASSVEAPELAAEFEPTAGHPVTVIVSFYVDEKGNVRLPNIESNTPGPLAEKVIKAVSAWKFTPPTIKGKPVLAFATRTLTFTLSASAPVAAH